jgi:hypothetical protein
MRLWERIGLSPRKQGPPQPRHQRDLQSHLLRASSKDIPVQERRLSGVRRTCRDFCSRQSWPRD